MNISTILILIAILGFAMYNIYVLVVFGIPENISSTFYLFNERNKYLGLLFPLMISFLIVTLLPAWLMVSNSLSEEVQKWSFLIYTTALGMIAIAASSKYKISRAHKLTHYLAAIFAAISAMTWIFIADWKLLYIPVFSSILISFAAFLTNTFAYKFFYWLELATIYTTQIALFVLSIR